MKITTEFMIGQGWIISEKFPLQTMFEHNKNSNAHAHIGKYGEFGITEFHWINQDEPVRIFMTINHNLTEEDYHKIIDLLKIEL